MRLQMEADIQNRDNPFMAYGQSDDDDDDDDFDDDAV